MDKIQFIASLPSTQSAIKIGQDSARIQLEVPASDLAAALRLVTLMGKTFIVSIEEEPKLLQTMALIEDQGAESGNGDGFGLSDPG